MMHPALLVKRGDRLGARHLAVRGMHRGKRHVRVGHAQHRLDHLAAIVDLRDDAVGVVRAVSADRGPGPFQRRVTAGRVFQHITVPLGVAARDDNAGFVGVLARCRRRIDRDDDAYQLRRRGDASGVDQRMRPQRTRHVVEQFAIQFLAAESRPLIAPHDLREKGRRQMIGVIGGAAAGHRDRRVGEQFADQFDRARRRRHDAARILS